MVRRLSLSSRNLLPDNIVEACFQYYSTRLTCEGECDSLPLDEWTLGSTMSPGTNILGVVMFGLVFGACMTSVGQRSLLVRFFEAVNAVVMEMTVQAIRLTPFAVIFLVLPQVIQVQDLSVMFGAIGYYSLTVVLGLAVQSCLTLPLLYWAVTRHSPLPVLRSLAPALVTAFGTSSSSATMPVSHSPRPAH